MVLLREASQGSVSCSCMSTLMQGSIPSLRHVATPIVVAAWREAWIGAKIVPCAEASFQATIYTIRD